MAKRKGKATRCKNAIVYRGNGKAVVAIGGVAYRGTGSWDGGKHTIAVCKRGAGYAVPTATGFAKLKRAKK
jgi:hypothetical protein